MQNRNLNRNQNLACKLESVGWCLSRHIGREGLFFYLENLNNKLTREDKNA